MRVMKYTAAGVVLVLALVLVAMLELVKCGIRKVDGWLS